MSEINKSLSLGNPINGELYLKLDLSLFFILNILLSKIILSLFDKLIKIS